MPAAMGYEPDNKELRIEADKEHFVRRNSFNDARAYYEGRHREHLKRSGAVNDNVTLNYWRMGKDREAAFLFSGMPIFGLDDNPDADNPDEQWLRAAWQYNQDLKQLRLMARYGALGGHVFARVLMSDHPEKYPRVLALNPANVIVFWRADDYETALWYEARYEAGDKQFRQDVVRQGDQWWFLDYERTRQSDSTGQQLTTWALRAETEWRYPVPPIIDWQHLPSIGSYYGDNEPELMTLNDRLNRVASDTSRILRFYASPKTVIQADIDEGKIIETKIEDTWLLPKESEIKNIEMQSDLQASVTFTRTLMETYRGLSRTVMLSGDPEQFRSATNLGVEMVFMDQLAKTLEIWQQYEPGLAKVCRTMLRVGERLSWEQPVKVVRQSPLPQSRKETMDVQAQEIELGLVSRQTVARERGRNWQEERERIEQEELAANEPMIRQMMRGL